MIKQSVDLSYAFGLPPAEVIKYFESKGYVISWNWHDVYQQAHAKAFTVAKVVRLDVLNSIRTEVSNIFKQGITEREFLKRLTPRLQSLGWWGKKIVVDQEGVAEVVQEGSAWRLKNIYQINANAAYAVGRYKAQKDNAAYAPYWRYMTMEDFKVRHHHAILNGRVYRFDDPIWDLIYPPNDWRCRCFVVAYTAAEVRANGWHIEDSKAGTFNQIMQQVGIDKRTGEVLYRQGLSYTTPDGQRFTPAAGWNYNPAQAYYQPELDKYAADIARQYVAGGLTGADFVNWSASLAHAAQALLAQGQTVMAIRQALSVGNRHPVAILSAIEMAQLNAQSQTVWLSDDTLIKQILHREGQNIAVADYVWVQKTLATPDLVVQDKDAHLKFLKEAGRWWVAVIKTTRDGRENYLQSFYATRASYVEQLRKKGRVLREK